MTQLVIPPRNIGWVAVEQEPTITGNYIVAVYPYIPVFALFIKGHGWDLSETIHLGLEHRIVAWMPLPEFRYDQRDKPRGP